MYISSWGVGCTVTGLGVGAIRLGHLGAGRGEERHLALERTQPTAYTRNPEPEPGNPSPHTPHPTPYTLCTRTVLNSKRIRVRLWGVGCGVRVSVVGCRGTLARVGARSAILHSSEHSLQPTTETLHPKPRTQNPKPFTPDHTPHTLHPTPSAPEQY